MFPFGDKKKENAIDDFFIRFNNTTNKLKKRFLKKPNIAEVSDEYCALADECESVGNYQYTAFCWLHVAKCQELLKDKHRQMYFLLKAGRKFIEIEQNFIKVGCPSVGNENFQAAYDIFDQAINLCDEIEGFNVVGSSLAVEVAKALGSTPDGIKMLRLANEKCTFVPAVKLLISYLIKEDDFFSALEVSTELIDLIKNKYGTTPPAFYKDILHEVEITSVLLLLLLRPTPKNLSSYQSQLLEKYTRENDYTLDDKTSSIDRPIIINNDQMILMQSLVLACQFEDYNALLEMEGEMWIFLTDDQKDLLRCLVKTYCKI